MINNLMRRPLSLIPDARLTACREMHRYLSDHLNSLPLGVLTRMVRTNDTLMALVPLLEEPPWVRKRNKKTEKFIGNVWTAVEPKDRLRLTQHDAQASAKDREHVCSS